MKIKLLCFLLILSILWLTKGMEKSIKCDFCDRDKSGTALIVELCPDCLEYVNYHGEKSSENCLSGAARTDLK